MEVAVITDENETLRLAARGRLTQAELARQPDPFPTILGPCGFARGTLLDLAEVEYIDSAALGWLLRCHKRFRESGGKLVLHTLSPVVADTFQIMRMDRVFCVAANERAAEALLLEKAP